MIAVDFEFGKDAPAIGPAFGAAERPQMTHRPPDSSIPGAMMS